LFVEDNKRIPKMGKAKLALNTIWSWSAHEDLLTLLRREKPDLVHFHNTFPLISPSAYSACRAMGVPVVQSLHNYRLSCPAATFFRAGQPCEACLGKSFAFPGVQHKCYRNSALQTSVVASMLTYHQWRDTWRKMVTVYIALSEFSRAKLVQSGLPAPKIMVKPNFVESPLASHSSAGRGYVLFAGRLSNDKGVSTLLDAWSGLDDIPLKVAGDGPLRADVETFNAVNKSFEFLGYRARQDVLAYMRQARFLVFPSEWYEVFPMTIVEAFASSLPVIASRLGAMAELIRDGETGLLFAPGDPKDLADKVRWLWRHPEEASRMGRAAREEYQKKYTPERNYQLLMQIYTQALNAI
jgi:glycosyltransferase involved in cell wall biosynthesis